MDKMSKKITILGRQHREMYNVVEIMATEPEFLVTFAVFNYF